MQNMTNVHLQNTHSFYTQLSDLNRSSVQHDLSTNSSNRPSTPTQGRHLTRSKSAPRSLNNMNSSQNPTGYNYFIDSGRFPTLPLHTSRSRIPRRLKFIYFWASTRLMQRLIMVSDNRIVFFS